VQAAAGPACVASICGGIESYSVLKACSGIEAYSVLKAYSILNMRPDDTLSVQAAAVPVKQAAPSSIP
jgi:hypothetical protein